MVMNLILSEVQATSGCDHFGLVSTGVVLLIALLRAAGCKFGMAVVRYP
jgi:hypothetical protein